MQGKSGITNIDKWHNSAMQGKGGITNIDNGTILQCRGKLASLY